MRFNVRGRSNEPHKKAYELQGRNKLCCFYGFLGWLVCVFLVFACSTSFGHCLVIFIITHSRICILVIRRICHGIYVCTVCTVYVYAAISLSVCLSVCLCVPCFATRSFACMRSSGSRSSSSSSSNRLLSATSH